MCTGKTPDNKYTYMSCSNCGNYILSIDKIVLFSSSKSNIVANKEKLAHYLFYNNKDKADKDCFIGTKKEFQQFKVEQNKYESDYPCFYLEASTVDNWYPKTFAEKINYALLKLSEELKYDGDSIILCYEQAKFIFFTTNPYDSSDEEIFRQDQIVYYLKSLTDLGYIEKINNDDFRRYETALFDSNPHIEITITPIGLDKIYELQQSLKLNKQVFVAMSFHKSKNRIRKAIKDGIFNAGYSIEIMDEIVHNHQIVPEMLRLIKESRFLVMDITEPNLGAYYEAGYAQGLGKEVIITCREDIFNQKEFICEKVTQNEDKKCRYKEISTKPHFDIAQKQILVWKNYKDLTKKLSEWIKYIIG